jgi:multisubunit Na+/H+ antiporter MnhB subunit
MSIVVGLIITLVGAIILAKTEWFLNNFGRIGWFEAKLGSSGGSRLGYKLIGLFFVFIGIIVMTGSGPAFINWLIAPLTRSAIPQ